MKKEEVDVNLNKENIAGKDESTVGDENKEAGFGGFCSALVYSSSSFFLLLLLLL